jgi:hypothetical protein
LADFKTHLSAGCVASGIAATGLRLTGTAQPPEVFLYFVMGIIGGILPDIDADNSLTIKLIFGFLAPVIAFPVSFSQSAGCSVAELFIIWVAAFLTIRYFILYLFTHLTVHRGVIHSVPAAVLSWFLTTILLHRVFHFSDITAWTGGFFLFLGFLIHLILDELNSFDFPRLRLKRSLGTALKLADAKDLQATALVYLLILALFFMTPSSESFFENLLNKDNYLKISLLPQNGWFQDLHRGFAEWME